MQDHSTAQAAQWEARAFDETQLARRRDISVRALQQWRRMGIGPSPAASMCRIGGRESF